LEQEEKIVASVITMAARISNVRFMICIYVTKTGPLTRKPGGIKVNEFVLSGNKNAGYKSRILWLKF
jgi:hypothetical protein